MPVRQSPRAERNEMNDKLTYSKTPGKFGFVIFEGGQIPLADVAYEEHAMLFAASRALLNACKAMDSAFDQCGPWNDPYISNSRQAMRDAIALAERGEQ